ncbi:TPR repeat protein 27 [Intoshia linei]|uniref:TPR repeat protein 27 n=1 Tax=Intoshia linei TaxID=1819745 RepID=A0A177AVX7_9BILA|nr:TPR repeat protein 27 [Intoshia linei]
MSISLENFTIYTLGGIVDTKRSKCENNELGIKAKNDEKVLPKLKNLDDILIYTKSNVTSESLLRFSMIAKLALDAFVSANFGANAINVPEDFNNYGLFDNVDLSNKSIVLLEQISLLISVDEIPSWIIQPSLWYFAHCVFEKIANMYTFDYDAFDHSDGYERTLFIIFSDWMLLRTYGTLQKMFDKLLIPMNEKYTKVRNRFEKNLTELSKIDETISRIVDDVKSLELFIYDVLFMENTAQDRLNKLFKQFNITLDGKMGKRTKFQIEPTSQLIAHVKSSNKNVLIKPFCSGKQIDIKMHELQDDTFLDNIEFEPKFESQSVSLFVQCIFMAATMRTRFLGYTEDGKKDEIRAYLDFVLQQDKTSSYIRIDALHRRSMNEYEKSSKTTRSLCQMEELNMYLSGSRSNEKFQEKIEKSVNMYYISSQDPVGLIQKDTGLILVCLGLFNKALVIFEKLNDWKHVILCLSATNKVHLVEKLIRARLENNPTPQLYCWLAEVTQDIKHADSALKLSDTHWRAWYIKGNLQSKDSSKESLLKSKEYFEKCVTINYVKHEAWFQLGSVCIKLEIFIRAIEAFQVCSKLQPTENVWCNLASLYRQTGDLPRALAIINEAIKLNFSNPKLWENKLIISLQSKNFIESYNSISTVIGMNKNWCNLNYITQFVNIYLTCLNCSQNEMDKMGKLCETICLQLIEIYPQNYKIWLIYSFSIQINNQENFLKKFNTIVKYFTLYLANGKYNYSNMNNFSVVMIDFVSDFEKYKQQLEINNEIETNVHNKLGNLIHSFLVLCQLDYIEKFETKHKDLVHHIAIDFYGEYLASCSSDKLIKIYKINDTVKKHICDLKGHTGAVWEVAWSHPRSWHDVMLASCSQDKTVIIWKQDEQNASWMTYHVINQHSASVNSIVWGPPNIGLVLACASSDGSISINTCQDQNTWSTKKIDNAHGVYF